MFNQSCDFVPASGGRWADWRGVFPAALLIVLVSALSVAGAPSATSARQYTARSGGKLVISGTSTLHDWTATSTALLGKATLTGPWTGHGASAIALKALNLTIAVKSLKSSEGGGMDSTMYGALHRRSHPLITYQLTKARLKDLHAGSPGTYVFKTLGALTVNGVAKNIKLTLNVTRLAGGGIAITTAIKLKMTEFGVQPPTAMFGVIRSGNTIAISAKWHLTQKRRPE